MSTQEQNGGSAAGRRAAALWTWPNLSRALGVGLLVEQAWASIQGRGFEPVLVFGAFALMGFGSVIPQGAR